MSQQCYAISPERVSELKTAEKPEHRTFLHLTFYNVLLLSDTSDQLGARRLQTPDKLWRWGNAASFSYQTSRDI